MQSCLLRKLIQLLELCVVQPVSEQGHIHAVLDVEMSPIRLPAANAMHTTVTIGELGSMGPVYMHKSQDSSVSPYVLSL